MGMIFKEVEQLNHIGAIRIFMKPNFNIFMEECFNNPKDSR